MKKASIALFAGILQYTISAYAAPEVIVCPSPSSIKEAGLDTVEKANIGETWIAIKYNQSYNTLEYWDLAIWPLTGSSEEKVRKKALKLISNLSHTRSWYGNDGISKICEYSGGLEEILIWTSTALTDTRSIQLVLKG